jgi:hypothetical protein
MLENDDKRDLLGMLTQSGSSEGLNGLCGLLGLRIVSVEAFMGFGGLMVERANFPLSSHHLCRSELAGGRPGSMES